MMPDRFFSTFQTAARGLAQQREKIAVASRNIANAGTSAPNGSGEAYKPQVVRSTPVETGGFREVLAGSIRSLAKTHPAHMDAPASERPGPSAPIGAPRNLGPEFEVVGTEKFRQEYQPNHPDADENGMVRYPDIDLIEEMTRLVSANRLYEANLSSIQTEKEIMKRSMEI